ncbi:MAG: type II toxin-antitoxin system RelE/ParE family toxin [Dokdonella sp.]
MDKWRVATTAEFDDWFSGRSEFIQVEVTAAVRVLEQVGPRLGRPLVDTLTGSKYANMKELRVKAQGQVIRIAFAFDPDQMALLLTAGAKQGKNQKRFYEALIRKADGLYAGHLAARQKKGR